MNRIEYLVTDQFEKDLRRLLKKFRSLNEDLETAKKAAIEIYHIHKLDNRSIFPIIGMCTEEIQVCKVKKFACKALKGKGVQSGIRVIYAFNKRTSTVTFIEIYYKGEHVNEDSDRIRAFLKACEK